MYHYTNKDVHCHSWLQEKNTPEDVSALSLAPHAQNFTSAAKKNVLPKFNNRLSWTLHKIYKYKGIIWAKFFRTWTVSKDIYGKMRIRENPYIHIF